MKKCLLILLGVAWGSLSFLFAEHVPADKALQVATHFTQQIGDNPLRSGQSLELAYAARPSLRAVAPEAYYYVFNRGSNNGYIVVAGDDRAYPILGYATTGDFSYEKIPDNMKWWLQEYADQIQYAYTNVTEPEAAVKNRWEVLQNGTGLPSLKSQVLLNTALWEQHSPFNDQCPMVNGRRAVTGCVATAMAIIMKYHKYPDQGTGSHSYRDDYGNNYSASFSTPYIWNQMLDDYSGNYTVAQGNAVATLMYHCGVSCEMNYNPSGSGTALGKIAIALPKYFKYDAGICSMIRDGHSDSEWASLIQTELNNNRPIAYGGTTSGNSGHAFVLAGYNSNSQYYVNWGWGKKYDGTDYNGWFRLSALTLDGSAYNYQQDMVMGIRRPAGGTPVHRFVIAKYQTSSKGLTLATTPIQKENFTVNVSTVVIEGSGAFNAIASIAHIKADGTMKGIVSTSQYNLEASTPGGYYGNLAFERCKISAPIEAGDQLCMVYTVNKVGGYQIVEGTPDLPTRINLTEDTPSTSYKVTWNTLSGVTISPVSGFDANSIAAGGTFKFTITNTTGKAVVVKNGTVILTPDAAGVYTISNIQKNIQLVLSLISLTYKVTWNTLSGVTVSPLSGYNANSIAAGGTFKFKITNTTGKKVIVKNGTVTLEPDASGVYTLLNIQANIQLTVAFEATYAITWNTLTGVTVVPEPGYDPASVTKGEDFKFKIVNTSGKNVIVKKSSTLVIPDNSGVYTILNVQGNTRLTFSFEIVTTYQVTFPVFAGFDIKASAGYNALSVPEGSDFKFTVTPKAGYEAYTVKVTANDVVLTPASGNVYTIRNVTANQTVKVEATPPDTPTTYRILSRADRGATLVPESGYNANAVAAGDDFKFHVSVNAAYREWEVKVEVDGLTLRPDSRGVYTISNIRADKNVIITFTEVYAVTFVKPKEDVKMVAEAGYDADRIVAGYDFKFHLVSRYTEDQLMVSANGVVLRPVGKIYTIYGIRENQEVTVLVHDVSNEKISADNVRIQVIDHKLCITHPTMKNVPVYVVSFDGTLSKADKLNGVYTELELPGKGAYIVSFEGFSRKIMVK